jgi:hypothetical protein
MISLSKKERIAAIKTVKAKGVERLNVLLEAIKKKKVDLMAQMKEVRAEKRQFVKDCGLFVREGGEILEPEYLENDIIVKVSSEIVEEPKQEITFREFGVQTEEEPKKEVREMGCGEVIIQVCESVCQTEEEPKKEVREMGSGEGLVEEPKEECSTINSVAETSSKEFCCGEGSVFSEETICNDLEQFIVQAMAEVEATVEGVKAGIEGLAEEEPEAEV